MEKLRREADAIITAGISAVLPDEAVKKAMKEMPVPSGKLILVAAGKAAR
jgi:hydroxypyruvate reductase